MGFIIQAHGVKILENGLSPMQTKLLEDKHPIRIGGAPTGAGKTYAFIRAVREATIQIWVLFVVPTQALARDIQQSTQSQGVEAIVWDHNQSEAIRKSGLEVWEERKKQVERLATVGGFLISTPESLGQLLEGRTQFQKTHFPLNYLFTAKHWVFDEAHTISERGFGFMHFWLSLVAYQHTIGYSGEIPKVTLLSATHSNLWEGWFDEQDSYLSPSLVSFIDEDLVSGRDASVRPLHGDVRVEVESRSVTNLFLSHGLDFLQRGERVLIIYDSLHAMIRDQKAIEQAILSIGLTRDNIFVVDGQDKQSDHTLDSYALPSGLTPSPHHRLIIGTSAIEIGVNYANVNCAFLDPGADKAALLQRIGRVSRGESDGFVWIAAGSREYTLSHVLPLQSIGGVIDIESLRGNLPLRNLDLKRAKALGSAYWSWLEQKPGHLRDFLKVSHDTLSSAVRPGMQLNGIRVEIQNYKDDIHYKNRLERWLQAIDNLLAQLRDFSPTVAVQFGEQNPIIEYSRAWILRRLDCSRVNVRRDDGIWFFPGPREQWLLDKPVRSQPLVAIHPFLGEVPIDAVGNQVQQLLNYDTSELFGESRILWRKIKYFISLTGLLAFDDSNNNIPGQSYAL